SDPFGLNITVDYILEPGSPTLKIVYQLENQLNRFNSISAAFSLLSSGNGPSINSFSPFDVNVEGLELQYGIPWITAYSEQSTYIYGVNSNQLVTTHIQGVDATIDASQLSNTWLGQLLAPAGSNKDTLTREFFVSVTPSDEVDAINQYLDSTPKTVDTLQTPVSVLVVDKATGIPIEGAIVEFQTKTQIFLESWPWNTFATTYTNALGAAEKNVPLISFLSGQGYRAVATAQGREDSQPIEIIATENNQLVFEMSSQGNVEYNITDHTGQEIPSQITFWQNDNLVKRFFVASGSGTLTIPPGDYDVGISRGFEYSIVEMPILVGETDPAQLTTSLTRMVDTTGYMSFDAHVHSSPSPDSEVSPGDRITSAAATGLEVVVSTDHEIITDLQPAITATQLDSWVATVIGQEVTATLPNHTIAYPIVQDTSDPRGGPIPWYGLDIAGIFAAEKARGAQVRTIAHPRSSYLNHIEWDRIAGEPGVDNLTDLAFSEDAQLWSWDFEALEYQNGPQNVYETGVFEDWMSFLNHGHRITATGASDVHGADAPGMPRTYFRSTSDNPETFIESDMISAVQNNQAIVSTGAFATITANNTAQIGDILTDTDGAVSLSVLVQAIPSIDIDHIKIYMNCDEVVTALASNPIDSAIKLNETFQITVPMDKDAHIVVLGFGKESMPRDLPQYNPTGAPRVTTNPIFIDGNGSGTFDAPGGKQCNI
ncbi:MAG: CehA/McbA family metallohydrolase, partial [Pseudomonadales bacterium]|nr:CehA/McbA family metallohydrolase [Pseudomonadales bacterium]